MSGTRAANRYAKAILDLANEANNEVAVNNDMLAVTDAIEKSDELKNFLESPIVSGQKKFNAITEIFASSQKETTGLFKLLLANKRFEILPAIALEYKARFDELKGQETAIVTTAIPLSDDLRAKVLAKIATFSSNNVTIKNIVDPTIIGGFILRMGDKQYNASVSNRLQQLKREFSN